MATQLTAKRLRAALTYDQATGVFKRAEDGRGAKRGEVAGALNVNGYIQISIDSKLHLAHRLAFLYVTGAWPKHEVDHKNGARDDNRWSNLRDVDRKRNAQNRRMASASSRTGILGVTLVGRRYQASISVGGKTRKLGYFDTAEQAAQAYINAKRVHHIGCTL